MSTDRTQVGVMVGGSWLAMMGDVSGITHSSVLRDDDYSGDYEASCSWGVSPNFGAVVTMSAPFLVVEHGVIKWGGLTREPDYAEDGTSVTVHATGYGAALAWYKSLEFFTGPPSYYLATTKPETAVQTAIDHYDAPFTFDAGSLGDDPIQSTDDLTNLKTLLMRAATMQGKRLWVDSLGHISFVTESTGTDYVVSPGVGVFGTADDSYISNLLGFYEVSATAVTLDAASDTVDVAGSVDGDFPDDSMVVFTGLDGGAPLVDGITYYVTSPSGSSFSVAATRGGTAIDITADGTAAVRVKMRSVEVEDDEASLQFGFRQESIDLSPLGVIDETAAQSYIDGKFALVGARVALTNGVPVTDLDVTHVSGAPASPRWFKAGERLAVPDVMDNRLQPETRGSTVYTLGAVTVNEDTGEVQADPLGMAARDFTGALAPPDKPPAKTPLTV